MQSGILVEDGPGIGFLIEEVRAPDLHLVAEFVIDVARGQGSVRL